jgi:hypothetical protein
MGGRYLDSYVVKLVTGYGHQKDTGEMVKRVKDDHKDMTVGALRKKFYWLLQERDLDFCYSWYYGVFFIRLTRQE